MKNITNVEKETWVAIPNKIFNGFNNTDMLQAKIIFLYYKLMLLTPNGSNKLRLTSLGAMCELINVKATSSTLKTLIERLNFLLEQGLISIDKDLKQIKKNDYFTLEFIITENLMSKGFTKLSPEEIDLFFDLEPNTALIFLYIKRCINAKYGYAFPTISTMALELGMSKNTVIDCTKELKEKNIIDIDNPNFYSVDNAGHIRKSNNTYKLTLDKIEKTDKVTEPVLENNRDVVKNDNNNIDTNVNKAIEPLNEEIKTIEVEEKIEKEMEEMRNLFGLDEAKEIEIPSATASVGISNIDWSNIKEIPF